jgi:prohibitin 1
MKPQINLNSLIRFIVIVLVPILVFAASFRTVKSGEVGVVTRFGATTGRVLEPGASFVIPFVESVRYINTKKLTYETTSADKQINSKSDYKDFPVDTNTKDGQQVDIYYTVTFSIDPTKAQWIVERFGSEAAVVEKIVKTQSRIWARNIPRSFEADDLYSGDGSDRAGVEISEKLKGSFEENGIILDSVGIREIKFSEQYVAAIEAKQIEAVRVETEKNRAEQAKFRKEATITEAEAQARAQELQRQTLSGELLNKLWIEKWDGKLPTYVTGESASNLIQLPQP